MEDYEPLPTDASERRKVQNRNAQRKFRNRRHRQQVNEALQLHGTFPPTQPLSWPLLCDNQALPASNLSPPPQQPHILAPQYDLSALGQQPQVSLQSAYGNGTISTSQNTASQENGPVSLNSSSDSEPMAMSYLSNPDSAFPMFDHDLEPAFTMSTSDFPIPSHDSSNRSTTTSVTESRNIRPLASDHHTTQASNPISLPPPGSNPQGNFPTSGNPQYQVPPTAPQQSLESKANSPDQPDSESNSSSSNNSKNTSPASSNPTDSEVTKHKDSMSALHIASHRGHTAVLSVLLSHSLDPNEPDGSGRPPLHLAAINGHTAAISLLLSHGARINATDSLGRTALHWAVLRGHEAVVKVFLDTGGADLNLRDLNDWSVLHVAVERGCEGTLRLLLGHGADLSLQARKCEWWKKEEKEVEDESKEERMVTEE